MMNSVSVSRLCGFPERRDEHMARSVVHNTSEYTTGRYNLHTDIQIRFQGRRRAVIGDSFSQR